MPDMGPKDIVLKNKDSKVKPWVVGVPAGVSVADHVKELQSVLGDGWQLDKQADPVEVSATEPTQPPENKGN